MNFTPIRYFDRGYLNGSGLPVRFMDSDGRFIDLYEQVTISTDDGWRTDKTFLPAKSLDECIAASRQQADDARGRYHTVYHPYFHPISLDVRGLMPWFDAMLAYTADLPRFSDVDWVAFNEARRSTTPRWCSRAPLPPLRWTESRCRSLTGNGRGGSSPPWSRTCREPSCDASWYPGFEYRAKRLDQGNIGGWLPWTRC